MHRARTYLCAPLGKEEPRYLRVRPEKVALTLISPQSLLTGSVERHAARLAELAATDGDHPDGKVDILAVGFGDATGFEAGTLTASRPELELG